MKENTHTYKPASFFRRLAAIFYDSLLAMAILILSTYALLPFTHGQAITSGNHLYQAYLLTLLFFFYGGFWYWRGQTLGMVAWKIKVISLNHSKIRFWQVLIRFITALLSFLFFGLGFFWILFNRDKRTLFDLLSKTKVINNQNNG